MPTEINIIDIANWFIHRASYFEEDITNIKIQKLVYYTQAWYLAFYNEPLFQGTFEAWTHGPVNMELYTKLQQRTSSIQDALPNVDNPNFSIGLETHLCEVFRTYGSFSTNELERLVHSEPPWQKARGRLEPDESSRKVISEKRMQEYYQSLLLK